MVALPPLTGGVVGLVWAAMAWLLQPPQLRCAAAGVLLARCSVAHPRAFCISTAIWTSAMPLLSRRDLCHAAENSEGFALRRLRRDLHGPAGRGPVRAVCGCAVAAPAAARSDPWQAACYLPLPCSACTRWARASMPPCSAERACSSCSRSYACWRPRYRLVLCGAAGLAPLAAAAGYCLAVWRGFRQLDGMSGDISGFGLTLGELAGAAVFCLVR